MLCTGRSDNGPRGAGGPGARGQGPGARGLGPRASGVDSPRGRRPEGLGGRRVWLKAGPHDSPLRGGADSRRGPEERTLGEVRRSDSPRGPATPNIDSPRGRARPASADSQPPPTPSPRRLRPPAQPILGEVRGHPLHLHTPTDSPRHSTTLRDTARQERQREAAGPAELRRVSENRRTTAPSSDRRSPPSVVRDHTRIRTRIADQRSPLSVVRDSRGSRATRPSVVRDSRSYATLRDQRVRHPHPPNTPSRASRAGCTCNEPYRYRCTGTNPVAVYWGT